MEYLVLILLATSAANAEITKWIVCQNLINIDCDKREVVFIELCREENNSLVFSTEETSTSTEMARFPIENTKKPFQCRTIE